MTTKDRADAVRLARRLLVDVLWKTSNIEVDGITFPDTQEIFDGLAPAGMRVDDIIAVNDIKHAWEFLLDHADAPVEWAFVSQYNRLVGEGLIRDAGALRTYDVRIGGTDWIPALPSIGLCRDTVDRIAGDGNPEDGALDLFCAIARGQWFPDGNKRTALMAANHALVHAGIGVLAVPPRLKGDFTGLLLSNYETDDPTPLREWLREHAICRLPGGLTRADEREGRNA